MKLVERYLVGDVEKDQYSCGQAYSKSQNVDNRMWKVAKKAANSHDKVVVDHLTHSCALARGFSVLCSHQWQLTMRPVSALRGLRVLTG